jgi:hypothetical protein
VDAFKVGSAIAVVLARSITKSPPCLSLLVISDWIDAHNVMMLNGAFPSIYGKIGPGFLGRSVVLNNASVRSSIFVGCGSPRVLHIDFGIKVKLFVPFQFFHTRGYAGVMADTVVVVLFISVFVKIIWLIRFTGTWEVLEMEGVVVVVVVVDCTRCCDRTMTFISTFWGGVVLVAIRRVIFPNCLSVVSVNGVHDRCLNCSQRVDG